MHRARSGALWTGGLTLVVAVVWWLATPAGFVGSLAGTCILAGAVMFPVGLFVGAGGDRVLDHLHPGANVAQMAEQGERGERRFLPPRPRWSGSLMMLGGIAYVAVGALLWQLR